MKHMAAIVLATVIGGSALAQGMSSSTGGSPAAPGLSGSSLTPPAGTSGQGSGNPANAQDLTGRANAQDLTMARGSVVQDPIPPLAAPAPIMRPERR